MNTSSTADYRIGHNMASQELHDEIKKAKGQAMGFGSYLYTPPENTADSFSQDDEKAPAPAMWHNTAQNKLPPLQAHTPPASPETSTLPSISTATGFAAQDTPLFPEQPQRDRARSQTPLFANNRSDTPPPIEPSPDYQYPESAVRTTLTKESQADIFPSNLGIMNKQDAVNYYNDRIAEFRNLREIQFLQLPSPRRSTSQGLDQETRRQLHSLSRPSGVAKPRSAPKAVAKPKASAATSFEKTTPPRRRTPKARTIPEFVDSAFPAAQPTTKHKRAPPSKKVEGENVNWTELPDYTPSTNTLDSNPKSLKASWHGNPLDLSGDPDRAHCHPQELAVAATLRLSCAQYLTNKRKIFQARLHALKEGKNFTKTAAQGACSIDVNKASQLWEAFDRVGWLKESWFQQFM